MDASALTEKRRTMLIYSWYQQKAASKREQTNGKSAEVGLSRGKGAVVAGPLPVISRSPIAHYSLDEVVFLALHDLFVYEAQQNLGPTKCSRLNYMWFASLTMAYNWIQTQGRIQGTVDEWDWTVHYPVRSSTDQFVWMNHAIIYMMPTLCPSFNPTTLLQNERTYFRWSEAEQTKQRNRVQTAGHWDTFVSAWTTWFSNRFADGSVAAAVPPTSSELPNGTTVLDVSTTVDPATFPNPEKWTPLRIHTSTAIKTQSYLTYNWKQVRSTALTTVDESAIEAAASPYFPSTTSQRNNEIADVVNLTGSLTETQKVIAEFWAGGPFTISPPGMCIWFWKEFMKAKNIAHTRGFNVFFYSGLDLAIHVFETARLVWGLKKTYMQARPIQEIRRLYRGQTLTSWNGTGISGESWTPYQETNFVTPPFADFPSGHSAFSQSFANVMTAWFGPTIPTTPPIRCDDLSLLSPAFQEAQVNGYGTFVFPTGRSLIQPSVVPATPILLRWTNWQHLADSAGISRQYGGIHANSAHTGSQALANELHTRVQTHWGLEQ